jgi:chemotaxis protein MotB
MQQDGIRLDQVAQVRGFADQLLRKPGDPFDPSNRRISLIVQYVNSQDAEEGKTDTAVGKMQGTEKN